ncbi:MAG TPA: hypothetical protein VFR73_18535 [Hyphomicrobiaceae bacterium]|jgi:hypothetical protein|nr:hypothetical protein [Hyphomicrobiaceae bacterium]HEX2336833.1 hypothetical protein [Hyphomicrobiaceae bacterium]
MPRTIWRYVLPTLTVFAAGQARAQTPPADIVKKIYDRAIVFCNGADVAPPYTDKFMREVFDKPVADRYLTRLHKSQVDFDIFIDGQDCKLSNLAIEPLDRTAATAVVRAQFQNFDAARAIDFEFHQSGGAWLISDMRYRHRPFTLRRYLKLKPRT